MLFCFFFNLKGKIVELSKYTFNVWFDRQLVELITLEVVATDRAIAYYTLFAKSLQIDLPGLRKVEFVCETTYDGGEVKSSL